MSELKFPAEVKERAISGSVALGDHGSSLQRIQLLPPPACPCDKQMAVDLGGLGRYREDQNEYYNLDSSGQAIASSRSCGRCSGVNRGREVDVAWNDSTCSDHYDQVYQERPLVPCGKESATGGKHFSRDSFRDRTFPCPGNGENGVMSRSQFLKFDADDNEEDGNGGMETPYETTDDYHHHHHHHRHERCHVNFDRTQEHQLLNEHREHPYQNLTKSGSNLSRSSGTAASLHSVFSSADADQHYMTSCSASLAPLSSSFYYTPGCYSQSADRNFIEECKTETISLRNKGKTKSPGVSLYSEISSHVDCRYEDSLEECQKVKVMTSDCRLPTTATYRIKNATVARLVPIDRVISEELDEMNRLDEPGSLPGDPSAAAEWNGTEVDGHAHSRHCGLENANDASDAAFSCPWKLRLDEEGEDSIISSINENEDFNMFEDEHEDYARLTKPLGRTAGSQDGVYSRNHRGSSDDACHDSETTTMSNSSKFLNAFGFLISREGEEASSHFLLRDFISELDISPPNSVSLSCLSLSPNSVDKTESLFETSSACLTDALGRSMDESSLSSFFVFETSGQGFPSNSTTMKKDDGSPDYTALVNRNERTKTYANDPGHRKEGFGTIGGSEIKNNMLNDIKQQQRPRQENSDDHVGNYRENEEMKSKDFIENPACGQIHNSTSTLSLTKSQLSTAQTPNGTTGKLSLATQSGSPSSILRKVSLFSNSKIPGSPKNLIRSNITTTALSNIPNSLHSSISVPFRHTPPPNRHTSRNSLPPLNQMKPPSSKCSAPSKTGGFFRFNSKLLGSAPASKSAAANQPAKTSPKATPKSERSIFKFSSPKNRRSSVTVTPGTGEEINTGTPLDCVLLMDTIDILWQPFPAETFCPILATEQHLILCLMNKDNMLLAPSSVIFQKQSQRQSHPTCQTLPPSKLHQDIELGPTSRLSRDQTDDCVKHFAPMQSCLISE